MLHLPDDQLIHACPSCLVCFLKAFASAGLRGPFYRNTGYPLLLLRSTSAVLRMYVPGPDGDSPPIFLPEGRLVRKANGRNSGGYRGTCGGLWGCVYQVIRSPCISTPSLRPLRTTLAALGRIHCVREPSRRPITLHLSLFLLTRVRRHSSSSLPYERVFHMSAPALFTISW